MTAAKIVLARLFPLTVQFLKQHMLFFPPLQTANLSELHARKMVFSFTEAG